MLQHEKDVRGSFWAAYFNIATNNVQTILRHVSEKRMTTELRNQEFILKQQADSSDDRESLKCCPAILSLTTVGKKPDLTRQLRIMKDISKALPFMGKIWRQIETGKRKNGKVLESPRTLTPQEFASILLGYVNYLFDLRNYFTHVKHAPVSKVEMSTDYLVDIFNANIGTTKERFYPEDKIANDDRRFLKFRKYLGMKTDLDEDGKVVKKPKDNPDFTFYLWEPAPAEGDVSECGTSSQRREPTAQGLAFFCCLFLEKKYANMALDSTGIQNNQNRLLTQFGFLFPAADLLTLIKRVFTITCARLPRTRIESESLMTNQVLGLDMLSTLHKCPRQLFELLSPENQNKFRTESEETGQEVLLRRFEDRFPYLSLNYLDRYVEFSDIRFCINMGNFYFRCHPRLQIDGLQIEDRRLKKRITCYTKIQDAINYYQAERVRPGTLYHVATPDNPNPPQTYRLDMVPQYEISDNRIGIALKSLGGKRELFEQPKLPVGQPKGKDKPKTYQPDAWLPIHELMPILFLATHGKANEIERAIRNHIRNWRKFLNDFSSMDMQQLDNLRWNSLEQSRDSYCLQFRERYGIDIMDIPDEMRYYLFNGKVKAVYLQSQGADKANAITANDAADIWLRKERQYNEALIRRFEREQKYDFKLGKGKQPRFTNGYIARWLVQDFMRFQKSNGQAADRFGKLKSSPDYMALQSALACFDSNRQSLRDLLIQARLIDGANYDHPFLQKMMNSKSSLISLREFFSSYLEERLNWLEKNGKMTYQLRRLYKRDNLKQQVQNGLLPIDQFFHNKASVLLHEETGNVEMPKDKGNDKRPVCLPRGLFDSLVRKTLQEEFPEQFAAEVPDGQRTNFTWLMQKYLQWSNDEPQWFYSLKASKNASQFKSLFKLMGTANLRYDSTGVKALNRTLDTSHAERCKKFYSICENASQKEVNQRIEEDDQMYHRLLNQLRDVWKEIRMVGVQDILLRDAIGPLLKLPQNKIQLKDVKPEHDLQQLRQERMMNPQKVIDGELLKDSLLNKKEQMSIQVLLPNERGKITLTGNMKRKNFGNFYRMLFDPRIASFLSLYHEFGIETVDYDYLELEEFEAYDRNYRPKVFDMIHKLESTVLEKYPEVYDAEKGYAVFEAIARKASYDDEFLCIQLIMYRNAFAHQYYPEYRSLANWEEEDKQQYDPLFQKLRDKIKADYLLEQRITPKGKSAILVRLIYDYAESLFRKAINNVKLSMD